MFAALLGVVIGLAVSLSLWAAAPDSLARYTEGLTAATADILTGLTNSVPIFESRPELGELVAGLIALTASGVIACGFAFAATALSALRKFFALVLALAAGIALFTQPFAAAAPVVVVAVIGFVLVVAPATWLTAVALWGFAAAIACDHVIEVWSGSPAVAQVAESFATLSGFNAPSIWKVVATLFGLAPVWVAAVVAAKR